eukprot:973875_1
MASTLGTELLLLPCSLATPPTMASTLGTELLFLLVTVSIGHCSNVCLSNLINGPTINAMDTNSKHYNLTMITTLGFIATVVMVVMAVLNITPTMDLSNIDTINTPNASQMLNTNNTVSHPTIQCLLYEARCFSTPFTWILPPNICYTDRINHCIHHPCFKE